MILMCYNEYNTLYTQSRVQSLSYFISLFSSIAHQKSLTIDEQMVHTYQHKKKTFKHARNQLLAAVTALKSTGRKVDLSTIQRKNCSMIDYTRECTDCFIREYWSANVATELQKFYGRFRPYLVPKCPFSQFHCIKVKEISSVPFSRNTRNCPNRYFTLPGIQYHIFLVVYANYLKLGMHEANKHITFGSKFGKN